MKLQDRVIVTTGSDRGIGRASAIEFGIEGARVVVADIDLSSANETVKEIEATGGIAIAVPTDFSDSSAVKNLVAAFLASDDAGFMTGSAVVVDGGFGSGLPPG